MDNELFNEPTGKAVGGKARAKSLSKEARKEIARRAANARWAKTEPINASIDGPGDNAAPGTLTIQGSIHEINNLPMAKWPGQLEIGTAKIGCYVLDDGRRIISRGAVTAFITDGKGGGNLEQYLEVEALKPYLPQDWRAQFIEFDHPQVVNRIVKGITAETFIDICQAIIAAWEHGDLTTDRQKEIAFRAAIFMASCAKVGLIALIDEATGYQYDRPIDALQFKLKIFLAEEMRKWERTFPPDLWEQFGRLTNWKGALNSRPKYWGKLVMELIYEYLDPDVAEWLRSNAPKPKHGQNYHQWLSEQYGLKKLVEHIWKVIGVASTCSDMAELKRKMQELYGKAPGFQYDLKLMAADPNGRQLPPLQ